MAAIVIENVESIIVAPISPTHSEIIERAVEAFHNAGKSVVVVDTGHAQTNMFAAEVLTAKQIFAVSNLGAMHTDYVIKKNKRKHTADQKNQQKLARRHFR